ncbi:EamA family transporter [Rhodococcus sp. SRB_17]|nr:EamA family transporter [Rhodococcus sp. SRB_17]
MAIGQHGSAAPVGRTGAGRPLHRVVFGNPVALIVGGAGCLSASAMFVKLSSANVGTAAFLRCALALIVLIPLAVFEWRRLGARPARFVVLDLAAGLLLGIDFVFWTASIVDVGASIATVLINIQVVIFPLLARLFSGTTLSKGFIVAAPLMLVGVALASGALGAPAEGSNPVSGAIFGTAAGVAYAGYLFLSRSSGGHEHKHFPVATSTFAAAFASGVMGTLWTGIDLHLSIASWGWMVALALLGQVAAWLLISEALPALAPNVSAALLLLQPVIAIALGIGFLEERATWTQYAGCVLVVAAVWYATRRREPVSADVDDASVLGHLNPGEHPVRSGNRKRKRAEGK